MEFKLKNYRSPMDTGYHPDVDDNDILFGTAITMYQMIIVCAQWNITLGRYCVQYATSTLARFGDAPRKGQLKKAIRIFGYLRYNGRGSIMLYIEGQDIRKVYFKKNIGLIYIQMKKKLFLQIHLCL